jgi:hypothetical protein
MEIPTKICIRFADQASTNRRKTRRVTIRTLRHKKEGKSNAPSHMAGRFLEVRRPKPTVTKALTVFTS